MRGVNRVFILGTLGKDPDHRFSTSGTAVCNFSMATNEGYKDKQSGEWKERAEWHNIVCFGQTAENVHKYLFKGSKAYVEGRLRTEKWTDKEGRDRFSTKIYTDNVLFLSERGQGSAQDPQDQRTGHLEEDENQDQRGQEPKRAPDKGMQEDDFSDEIPF